MNDISQALLNIAPGAEWTIRGNSYADIEWHDKVIPKPTKAEVEAGIADLPNQKAKLEEEQKTKQLAKESALAKLSALGLTESEISALIA